MGKNCFLDDLCRCGPSIFAEKKMKTKKITNKLEEMDGRGAVKVTNLRLGGDGVLRSIGGDVPLKGYGGWRPLARLTEGRLPRYLLCRGGELAVAHLSQTNGPTPLADSLPSEPTATFTGTDGTLNIVCREGVYEFKGSGSEWTLTPAARPFPTARLQAAAVTSLSVTVGARKLSASYGAGSRPNATDLKALISDFEDAYRQLTSEAAAMGRYVQPVLARCAYYDRSGRCVHRTAPVVVSAGGAQLADGVLLANSDATTVAPYTLTASTYVIEAAVEPDTDGRVARVEVEVSPQFHSWSPTSPTVFTPVRDSAHGIGRLTPGGAATSASPSAVFAALARIDSVCTSAATLGAPSAMGVTATVANCRGTDIAAEARAFGEALGRPVNVATPMECLLTAPHTFGASALARSGGVLLWGNLHAVRFGGYSPAEYAAASGDGAWRALVVTWFGNGRRGVQSSFEGAGAAPTKLGPLVCYPSPDATRMSVILYSSGTTRRADFELRPSACGRFSAWVNAGLTPVTPREVSAALIVDIENADEDFDDAVAVGDASAPLALRCCGSSGTGGVAALCAADGSDSSWEFGRHRFVAACARGLLSATVSGADSRKITLRSLDSRGTLSRQSLCAGAGGVYAAVEGALLLVGNDARRVRTLWNATYSAVARDIAHNEVIALGTAGARAFEASATHGSYRRGGVEGCGVATVGSELFFTSSDALILPESSPNSEVEMEYEQYADYGEAGPCRPVAFGARISGSGLRCTLTATPGNDERAAVPPTTLKISGAPAYPVRGALHGRSATGALLRLAGAGKYMVFNHFTLEYER